MARELRISVAAPVADDVLQQAAQIAAVAEAIEAMLAAFTKTFGEEVKVDIAVVVPKPRGEKGEGA